jgi:hypothetical protein
VLLPFLEGRSCLEPVAKRRIIKITIMGAPDGDVREPDFLDGNPFLQKISAAYNGYLGRIADCLSSAPNVVNQDPRVFEAVYGTSVLDGFSKTASTKVDPAALLGAVGGAYALSELADWQKQKALMRNGKPVNALTSFVAEHPKLMMLLASMGALHQQGSPLPSKLLAGLKAFFKQ